MPTRPFSQLFPDQWGLVRGIVIHDEMDVELARHGGLDLVQELAELGGTVPSVALADDPSDPQCRGRRTVMWCRAFCSRGSFGPAGRDASATSAGCGPALGFETFRPHIERWRAPAARRKGRRRRAPWPRSSDRSRAWTSPADAAGARRLARCVARSTPTGRWPSPYRGNSNGWRSRAAFQRPHDHGFDTAIVNGARRPRARLIVQPGHALLHKAPPPFAHRPPLQAQLGRHFLVLTAFRAGQHDPGSQSQACAVFRRIVSD